VKIFVAGYFGFANAGDEAILASLLEQLRRDRPDVDITVSSGDPASTSTAYGVRTIARHDIQAIDRAIAMSDLVLVGGGGLFQDYWGADPDTLLSDEHWGLTYWAGCALLGALHRKPVMLCAVGVGPIESEQGARLTKAACQAATAITVRDEGSKAVLVRIGVPTEKVRMTADLAFAFSPHAPRIELTERRPVLGVAVRPWSIGVHPDFFEREIASALDMFLEQTRGAVVFLPFQQIEGEHEDDRAIAQRIVRRMRFSAQAVIRDGLNAGEIYRVIEQCDGVLAMRLHALIFAAMSGVGAVAVSYDPKLDSTLAILAAKEPALALGSLDAAVLARRLIDLQPDEDGGELERLRDLAIENCSIAIRLAGQPGEYRAFSPDILELLRRSVFAQIRRTATAQHDLEASRKTVEGFDAENASLRGQIRNLEAEKAGLHEAMRARSEEFGAHFQKLDAEKLDLIARLNQADAVRFATVSELDRYRAAFIRELEAARTQKAWQLMLLMGKAYTLLVRGSAGKFLRWSAGIPFAGVGSLAEYEPRLPDIAGYVPDSFRQAKWLPDVAEGPAPKAHPPQRDRFDVIILAIIDFDFRFQRPQQIAAELARRGHRVFCLSPSRFLPLSAQEKFAALPLRENLWEVHLRTAAVDVYLGELKNDQVRAMEEAFRELVDTWNIGESMILAQLPFWRKLGLSLREQHGGMLVYDCMDDWETFENMGAFNLSEEKSLVREADVLVVTGAELVVKFKEQALEPVLIRNGADYTFFAQARPSDVLKDVPHPIVGYFGAIADWIDLDLVYEVAKLRPQYSFVLIGQVFGRDTSQLASLPNVYLLGSKSYQDIPSYLYHFDACTIPFLLNQVTKATDPVKLYEYFSLGKPVVATDMKELAQCGDLLYIGRGAEDFASKVDAALEEGAASSLPAMRIAFAKTNTWQARVDQFEEAVRAASPLVSILVVTHNSEEFVGPCLDSILRNTAYPSYEVILLDNASTDGTVELLREYRDRSAHFRLVELSENTGFAAGNNRAVAEACGAYLIFLNVDTMVTPGWIHLLMEHIRKDPSIGLLCPVTNFAGNEAKLNVSYRGVEGMEVFAAERTRGHRGRDSDVRSAAFFCALVPRGVWETVGDLDSAFGMGMFEDDDFAMRVRQAGRRVVVAEDCFVHHFGQGSFSKIPRETYERVFEENRRRFEEKWKQRWQPHRVRAGVRPPFEEQRFTPAGFV